MVAALAVLFADGTLSGQSNSRAVFVSNNGNLEGSVTAFSVNVHFVTCDLAYYQSVDRLYFPFLPIQP